MTGSLNSCHKMSEETKYATYKKQSISMKKLIKNGSFTPPITNSWANSRSKIKIDGTIYKFRSTWEAMFWALNTSFQYEKTRISYKDDKNIEHIYIVDFTSEHDKKIIEIKPNRNRKINKNILKEKSAIKWAKENGYEYIIIGEEYFYENYNILYDFFKNNKLAKKILIEDNNNLLPDFAENWNGIEVIKGKI